VAFCVGTVSVALLANDESVENSLIGTPRLNPRPSKLLNAMAAENDTLPVPWSTLKYGPTLKLPYWSVVT
jgi:hypothetical protein